LRRKFGGRRRKPDMKLDERSSLKRFGNGVESTYVAGVKQQTEHNFSKGTHFTLISILDTRGTQC